MKPLRSLHALLVTAVVMALLFVSMVFAVARDGAKYALYVAGEHMQATLLTFKVRTGLMLFAAQVPNGSLIHLAASYGAWKAMTAVTNANPAVATLEASHGIVVGDVMEVNSGWSKLDERIVRAVSVATNDVGLEGIDTTLTTNYSAGGGVGRIREILSWTQLTQILTTASSGGDQQFQQYQFLESDGQRQIPTTKNAASLTLSIADDSTLAGFQLVQAANEDRLARAVRITLPSGAKLYYNAYVTLSPMPSMTVNEIMAQQVTLSLLGAPTRYTS